MRKICVLIMCMTVCGAVFTEAQSKGFTSSSYSARNVDVKIIDRQVTESGYRFSYESNTIGALYFYIQITYKNGEAQAFKKEETVTAAGSGTFAIIDARSKDADRLEIKVDKNDLDLTDVFRREYDRIVPMIKVIVGNILDNILDNINTTICSVLFAII